MEETAPKKQRSTDLNDFIAGKPTNGALCLAAATGNVLEVRRLLSHGADVNTNEGYPLCFAASGGHLSVVQCLLSHGADIHIKNDNALAMAAFQGRLSVIEYLLEKGADVNANDGLALTIASLSGHLSCVQSLLSKGADIHILGNRALCEAVIGGSPETVRCLLDHGADLHANEEEALRTVLSLSPLLENHLLIIQELILRGADPKMGLQMIQNKEPNTEIDFLKSLFLSFTERALFIKELLHLTHSKAIRRI